MATKNHKAAAKRLMGIRPNSNRPVCLPPVCEGGRTERAFSGPQPELVVVCEEEKQYEYYTGKNIPALKHWHY